VSSSFQVHQAFALAERGLFALSGEIREGMVLTGMTAALEDAHDAFQERIHTIEYLDRPGITGRPTLTFHYRDPAKLERWLAIRWEGRTLSLGF
jgi:hypothetical protein